MEPGYLGAPGAVFFLKKYHCYCSYYTYAFILARRARLW